MSYQLGIDFGTTFISAAVRRGDEPGGTEVVPLAGQAGAVPSVLHLARDGRVTVGDAAAGLAGIDPTRVVRGLKRMVGDPGPIVLGGHPWTAEELSARMLRWVVDRVTEREGAPPARVALAHPASWAAHTLERLAAALAAHDLGVTFLAEPRAVAHAVAGDAAPGDVVGLYDLGGGRFDAAVLRREGPPTGGFAVLGVPESITDLGGLDLDELVWQHVRASLPGDVAPVARIRRACTRAKETLSSEDEVVVRIRCGELRAAVRLDRTTYEGLIAPHVDRTVAALRRTIASAGLEPRQLTDLLLVGGSARIPLVARTVAEQLGCTPGVHADCGLVARGAVLALSAPAAEHAATLVATASGYLAVPSRTVRDVVAEPAGQEASVASAARTALLTMDPPTEPVAGPAATPDPAAPEVAPAAPVRPSTRRPAAVLDPATRHAGRRSLPRILLGVGAVIAAALVLVALFRPDGPLDPPLDPAVGDGIARTVVPVPAAVVPPVGVANPTAAEVITEPEVGPSSAAVRPAGDVAADPRSSVTTTPPALPVDVSRPAGGVRAEAPPTGMTPPVPSTPAAPVV